MAASTLLSLRSLSQWSSQSAAAVCDKAALLSWDLINGRGL